ncbi:hypothetical protein AX15_004739 [Amanita polypyramis BW_CC]|nr:hypothetical protein AX15_004739 [Amanita polypyramis BW_CC]
MGRVASDTLSPMPPYLETVPSDILQHIAYLTSSAPTPTPPSDLLALMLTNSGLYRQLNTLASPHLYAELFRTKFDFSGACCPWRTGLADSVLAGDFVQRFKALRRGREMDLSSERLHEVLWAALWMAVENDGLNEKHFSSVNFPAYTIELARQYLNGRSGNHLQNRVEIQSLIACLLCYTFTEERLAAIPREIREELLNTLRPLTNSGNMFKRPFQYNSCLKRQQENNSGDAESFPCVLSEWSAIHAAREGFIECGTSETHTPSPLSSAIILIFAIKELAPLAVPLHLPETRAAAIAANRSGPTLIDFQATIRCKTPLFADVCVGVEPMGKASMLKFSRNEFHDPELHMLVRGHSKGSAPVTSPYLPGTLSGVWEGSYLVSSLGKMTSATSIDDFVCRKPMQCAITEHLCYLPHQTLPHFADEFFGPGVSPRHIRVTEDGVEIDSRNYCYEKLVPAGNAESTRKRKYSDALDIFLHGETLEDHEQAWGGFKFAGRVRGDGSIFMKRQPKYEMDDNLGTWYFVGQVRYGSAFVGQWRSSLSPDRVQGIFSMHKTKDR